MRFRHNHNRRNFWQTIPALILILLLCLWAFLSSVVCAGMIEYTDDDQRQIIRFVHDGGACDTTVVDSIQVWVQINSDSGFAYSGIPLTDSMLSIDFKYIVPDRDSLGNLIPGHYTGQYWYYTTTFYGSGQGILSPDTIHQEVDYHIIGGCLPVHEVD